ncbi:MAG: DUF721 domain-containing protein [Verrucomicrobiae bacterium]|nr:DUF721 domain-containing protein [Verrucomicrobiae bacterium]
MTPALRAKVLREWQPYAEETPPPAQSLAELVPVVIRRLGLQQRLVESQLFTRWAEIVGEFNARICQPLSLRKGRLTIVVGHPAYIQELRPYKSLFLQKIRERLGCVSVREIVFRVG